MSGRSQVRRFLTESTAILLTMSWVAYYPIDEVSAEYGRRPVVVAWR